MHATIHYEPYWSRDKRGFCTVGAVRTSADVKVLLGSLEGAPGVDVGL